MVTVEDVQNFGNRWFETVERGRSAEDQATFFCDKHARMVWNGVTFSMEEYTNCTRNGSTSGNNSAISC